MPATDKSTVHIVVVLLGIFLLASLLAVFLLIDSGQTADRIALLATPMGVALGAIATILVSTRTVAVPVDPAPAPTLQPPAQPLGRVDGGSA